MAILKYSTTDEVIKRANNHRYGLAGGLMSQNLDQANYISKRLRCGQVYVNCYHAGDAQVPFGGFRDSGIGR